MEEDRENLIKELNRYLSVTTTKINHLISRQLKKTYANITVSHLNVLFFVETHENTQMKDIGEKLCIKASSATNLVDKLIGAGLIERYTNPDDRRVVRVRLTEKGIELLKNIDEAIYTLWGKILAKLDENEYKKMLMSVKRMDKVLDEFM